MIHIPEDLKYTTDHEWVRIDGDTATVGITDYAQQQLGEIIYVELPEAGQRCNAKETMATVESVKAASDAYAPVEGEVLEVNQSAVDNPSLINQSPYEEGWLVKLRVADLSQIDALLSNEKYAELTKE